MYSKRTGLVLGFHGCDRSVRDKVIRTQNGRLKPSVNKYDWLGNDLYPNAGFKEKNHIQIAIRNPNCIKGYFIPRELDEKFAKP